MGEKNQDAVMLSTAGWRVGEGGGVEGAGGPGWGGGVGPTGGSDDRA